MEKIWIIKSRYSWKLCKSQSELMKRIGKNSNCEILEYELKSNQRPSEILLSKERDIQLRSVLGELSDFEKKANDLITLFEKIADDGKTSITSDGQIQTTEKQSWLSRLKKWQDNQVGFKNLLVDNKKYFLQVSSSTEWLVTLLKCHNFMDCKIIKHTWDAKNKKYIYRYIN